MERGTRAWRGHKTCLHPRTTLRSWRETIPIIIVIRQFLYCLLRELGRLVHTKVKLKYADVPELDGADRDF
jgi:hypothetical protein